MKLTKDKVRYVSKLANLPLTNEQEEKYSNQLSNILDYFGQLQKLNTKQIKPTFNITPQKTVFSEDQTLACLNQEEALQNAQQKKDGFIVTKGVFRKE